MSGSQQVPLRAHRPVAGPPSRDCGIRQPTTLAAAGDAEQPGAREGLHVLLVEDQTLIALDTENMLRELGAERIDSFTTLNSAMEWLQAAEPDASIIRPVVAKIADALHGRPLADAESVIEAARRILWMRTFTGVAGDAVMTMLNASSSARYAAAEITAACTSAADPLLAAERVLLEAAHAALQLGLWHRARQSGGGLSDAPLDQAEPHPSWRHPKPDLSRPGRSRAA